MPEGNFEADIKRMNDLFNTLKHEYDLYFTGTRKSPPARERADLDQLVRHYGNGTLSRTGQLFQFNAFSTRYSLQCEQWAKWSKAKEEGLVQDPRLPASMRAARDAMYRLEKSAPGRVAPPPESKTEAPPPAKAPAGKRAARPLGKLFDEFLNAKLEQGQAPEWDYEAFESHLNQQREAILAKYAGRDVVFTVRSQDGKVSLKAKVIK